ncbi:3-oxoacyl-[acyl-carrier-protein] synthase III C-terminal domain-containing protein [Azospirillum sp. HJ39]|uniref:3-oxoacyl-[acyl-carrier-protein] synthase III C-terminal domain-containing protein n=1 Tax=Azospirillum sp. HJ39 TaxID=3159496 RepID=UPI0035593305
MSWLNSVDLAEETILTVPLQALGASHGLSVASTRMYERFYGLKAAGRSPDALGPMLSRVLQAALERLPDAGARAGQLIYCKTQTHNTLSDRDWLRRFADEHGLARWETYALSMTSCASALVHLHFAGLASGCGAAVEEPVIVLTGEKAFHPNVARLSVGLLAEIPAAALFNSGPGSWRIRGTRVRHLPRFYKNPDAMEASDRRDLQDVYTDTLIAFIGESLHAYKDTLRDDFVFLPHNLNRPVIQAVLRHFNWEERTFHGDLEHQGHAYCSDGFINLRRFERCHDPVPAGTQLLILAAGTGVTFATCLFERAPSV